MITHVAVKFNGKIYSLPKPNRHHHVIHMIYAENGIGINGPDTQGFLDNKGRFYGREDALAYARKVGQVTNNKVGCSYELFSEDLW